MVIFWYGDTKQIFLILFLENYLSPSSPAAYRRAHLESILSQIRAYIQDILQRCFLALLLPTLCCACGLPGATAQHVLWGTGCGAGGAQATLQKARVFPRLVSECGYSGAKALGKVHTPRHKYPKFCTS